GWAPSTRREPERHACPNIGGAQPRRCQFQGAPCCSTKGLERNRSFYPTVLYHSNPVRAQRKGQRPVAGENHKSNAAARRASESGCSRRSELHRWQRAHRSLCHDRNAAIYVLTTNGHEWTPMRSNDEIRTPKVFASKVDEC